MPIPRAGHLAFLPAVISVTLALAGCGGGGGSPGGNNFGISEDSDERTDLDAGMISDAVTGTDDDPGTVTDTNSVSGENPAEDTSNVLDPVVNTDTDSNPDPVVRTNPRSSPAPVVNSNPGNSPAPVVNSNPGNSPAPVVSTNPGNTGPDTGNNSPDSQTTSDESTDPDSYGDWLNARFDDYGMSFVGSGGNYNFQQGQATDLRVYHPHSSSNFDGATFSGVVAGKVRGTGVQKSGTVSISFTADGTGAANFNLNISGIGELVDVSGHITAGEVRGVRYWRIYEATHGYQGGQRHSQTIDANFYNQNRLNGKIQSWIGPSIGGRARGFHRIHRDEETILVLSRQT